jgi:hypothetical protein
MQQCKYHSPAISMLSCLQVLDTLLSDAEQLAASVHSTSELSEGVSFKVRELDTAQSRIDDTLQRISIVVDRSNAVDGIRGALEVGDYETAAEHVSKYLDLERRFGTMTDEVENRQLQDQRRVRHFVWKLHPACIPFCSY